MKKTFLILSFLVALSSTIFAQKVNTTYDIIVAKDGSGNFTKVQDAFDAVPDNNSKQTIIFVKPGIYKEKCNFNWRVL